MATTNKARMVSHTINKDNSESKFQFVTGLHGNEHTPILALVSLGKKQLVANPQAVAANKRFIEKDMNASFGTKGDSLEEKQARQITKLLDKNKLIVDLHTTQTTHIPFVIIVDKKMIPFAQTLGVKKVVYMNYNIKKGHALINHFDGVSVECGKHNSKSAFNTVIKLINNIKTGKKYPTELYEVYAAIKKKGNYKNFVKHKSGFYPLFTGKTSYNIIGLKARKIKEGEKI